MMLAARRFAALCLSVMTVAVATEPSHGSSPVRDRHLGVAREFATARPLSEADQAVVEGWPMYRTARGQSVFNEAMATLEATDSAAPRRTAFMGCADLDCALRLPATNSDGWLPAGRLWVSPARYVLLVRSPRQTAFVRRSAKDMKVFVFHEFHNSSRNTDVFDTISSHGGSVFTPLYMSKTMIDAHGREFVVVVQVAPLDVVSVHATVFASAGPGIEVAKNSGDALEPLQGLAGIVVGAMVVQHAPRVTVVNHRGLEGLPMLERFQSWRRAAAGRAPVVLPFTPAHAQNLARATGDLPTLVRRDGLDRRQALQRMLPERSSPTGPDVALPPLATGFTPAMTTKAPIALPMLLAGPRPVARSVKVSETPADVPVPEHAVRPVQRWSSPRR